MSNGDIFSRRTGAGAMRRLSPREISGPCEVSYGLKIRINGALTLVFSHNQTVIP